ncbi:MAG: helicase-exonuclease AddAB subunit AddA, partial [Lachnospiraceae bacterium]|nr:helicase-exonuclease AddAB subunit AddA [Lachnospiraceae bacterium]
MSRVEFTSDQKKVIEAPICDLLVSAAAGSGKTAVLVERIMKQICDPVNPVDIDRILIVTFTRNAAASMKDRIHRTLEKVCSEEPENRYLNTQLQKLSYADITTIDSFCLKVVRSYFFVTDIDPNFRMADSSEADILLYDAISEVLEKEYECADTGFMNFMSTYGGTRNDNEITELVKKLIRVSGSYPWQRDYINNLAEMYYADSDDQFIESALAQDIVEYSRLIINDCIDMIKKAYSLSLTDELLKKYSECLDDDMTILKTIAAGKSYRDIKAGLESCSFKRAPSIRNAEVDEDALATIKLLRDMMKELLKKLTAEYYSIEVSRIIEDNKKLRPYIDSLARLTLRVLDRYEEIKKNRNIMEFSDVAHAALDILVTKGEDGSAIPTIYAEEIRRKYDEIMIDEYQDSNLLQEVILNSVSGRSIGSPNIFMVGDVKQSIYKFRMAKPELFMEKYNTFGRGEDKSLIIDLKKNFRSAGSVINTVNDVFSHVMTDNICGISYDENAALNQGADYGEFDKSDFGVTEYHMIDTHGESGEEKYLMTATAVAQRIHELMASDFTVMRDGVPDRLRYSDIVILVRTMSGSANVLASRLPDEGIPACVNNTTGYFKTIEITLMLNYLRILDNPYQDIEMAAVLRSYCCGLTDEELALIKIFDKSVNEKPSYLYEAAAAYMNSEDADDESKQKLSDFFSTYEKIRCMASYAGIHDVLLNVYERTGYYNYVSILPAGSVRKANLDMLLVKASDYEKTDFVGINSFLRYVDKLIKYDIDMGEAASSLGQDAVRIMTIHASKGLEYPVVILADTEKQFNRFDENAAFVLHSDLGIGMKVINEKNSAYHKSIQKQFITSMIHRENIAEEIRILYVALTRARQKLIMFGAFSNPEKNINKWILESSTSGDTLSYSYLSHATCYADFMLPVFLLHLSPFERGFFGKKEETVSVSKDLRLSFASGDSMIEQIAENIVEEQSRELPEAVDGELYDKITEYFAYKYPYVTEDIPVKYSVSELKHEAMEEFEIAMSNSAIVSEVHEDEITEPAFITGKEKEPEVNKGALRGTLTHLLMQKVVTEDIDSLDKLFEYVDKKIVVGEFTEDIRMVNLKKVFTFLQSELGHSIKDAYLRGELYLEQPF